MSEWAAGTRLGPYELESVIGAGGMGQVWKARDTRLGRSVAIKRLAEKHSARFEQEARAIAALNHPHICTLHDVGPDYLVMEYVEGKPLKGPLPAEEALRLARQIASALEAAHAKGILHRDLKPGNVLVTSAGVKLLDFGLAKILNPSSDATQTMEGTIAGTAAYMSPEQARGEQVDARSDIFSFGSVLYELITGRRAFTGSNTTDILSAVVRDEPRDADAPADLVRVLRRCLRKQREERYGTTQELTVALDEVKLNVPDPPSIAVLPFANMSRDADDEFFSDGLAEEIINLLAHVPGLKVTARTSAFAFRGKEQDITKIAEALRVKTILEGSVRRAGSRIRVTAQLINAADGYHLWSERYDRNLDDVFAIQDEIAAAIADALKLTLAPTRERHKPSLPAYEAYLKYRHYQWSFTRESLRKSREYLEQAVALDPKFALPYVGLADHHLGLSYAGFKPAEEQMPIARRLAERALELDPELGDAHAMLGILAGEYDRDWQEAERRFQRAFAVQSSSFVRCWYAVFYLLNVGRLDQARTEMELYLKDDPLSQVGRECYADVLLALGEEGQALEELRRSIDLDPSFWVSRVLAGVMHAMRGESAEALKCAEAALSLAPTVPWVIGLAAGVLHITGQVSEAEAQLAKLSPADAYGAPTGLFVNALVRGDFDGAVEWAGKAVDQKLLAFIWTILRPHEKRLRQSPGWPALLKKINLTEATR